MLFAGSAKRLVRALDDALRSDVDPRAGGHLAVHDEAQLLQFVELLPVRPVANQVGVADEHARRIVVRTKNRDRLARLHQQRLVVLEQAKGVHDGVVALPVASGAAGSAIHDEVLGTLGDFLVEVVHQHAHGGFLRPSFAGELIAARRFNRDVRSAWRINSDWHNPRMLVGRGEGVQMGVQGSCRLSVVDDREGTIRLAGVARGFEKTHTSKIGLCGAPSKKIGERLFDRPPTLFDQVLLLHEA